MLSVACLTAWVPSNYECWRQSCYIKHILSVGWVSPSSHSVYTQTHTHTSATATCFFRTVWIFQQRRRSTTQIKNIFTGSQQTPRSVSSYHSDRPKRQITAVVASSVQITYRVDRIVLIFVSVIELVIVSSSSSSSSVN